MGSSVSGGKPAIAGTYITEQTAVNTFNIVSVRSTYGGDTAAEDPGTHLQKKKRNPNSAHWGQQNGCTELPALKTLEPLLDKRGGQFHNIAPPRTVPKANAKSSSQVAQGSSTSKAGSGPARGQAQKGAVSGASRVVQIAAKAVAPVRPTVGPTVMGDKRAEDPEVFDRLFNCRGRRIRSNSVAAVKSSDEKLLNQLTEQADKEGRAPNSESWCPPTDDQQTTKHDFSTRKDHRELFASLTGQSSYPINSNRMGCKHDRYRDRMTGSLQAQLSTIEVIPSNPVKAFFEAEQRAIEEAKRIAEGRQQNKGSSEAERKEKKIASRQSLLQKAVDFAKQTSDSASRGAGKGPSPKKHDMWDDVLEMVLTTSSLSPERREACEAMRLFLFGKVGNESSRRARDQERTFYETQGSQDQILELYKVWRVLDADGSGRVDFTECKKYLQQKKAEAESIFSSGSKQANAAERAEKAIKILLSKKSSFVIEDMIRICWPCAHFKDIVQMKSTIDEAECAKRVPAPPVLPQEELNALIENFQYLDRDGSGNVTIMELVESGMVDADTATKNMELFDMDGSGELSVWEFCEMFCRPGFRAYPEARTAMDDEGNRLYYDDVLGWRPARGGDQVHKGNAGQSANLF